MRKTIFANGEYYHVYNRGVDKREVFIDKGDLERFLVAMNLLNNEDDGLMLKWRDYKKAEPDTKQADLFQELSSWKKPIVEINAYCLNPNHYHLILRQVKSNGVSEFMHRLGTSHTNYFNKKNERSGSLFQGTFKAIHVDSNEYLLYLSAYVNENYFIHGYGNKAKAWKYSSLAEYLTAEKNGFCCVDAIRGQFRNAKDYKEYVKKNALNFRGKKELKKYILE